MNIKWNGRHRESKSRLLYPLLAVVLVLSMVMAVPGLSKEAKAVELSEKNCSLTIDPGKSEPADDLAKANVVVDIYMIAKAVPVDGYDAYTYDFLSGYEEAKNIYDANQDNGNWEKMAQAAAKHALEDNVEPDRIGANVNSGITDLDSGLYLLIARGSNLTDLKDYKTTVLNEKKEQEIATIANSPAHVYTFAPVLVSLPGRLDADGNQSNTTGGNGSWNYTMSVTLKPQQSYRLGSLEIVKNLATYNVNVPAMFVFQVEAKIGNEVVYSDVVTITFTEAGQEKALIDKQIPVGADVTVTEVYSGASYKVTSSDVQNTQILNASDIASVTFANDYSTTTHGGGGVNNHFTYDAQAGWQLKQQMANPANGE